MANWYRKIIGRGVLCLALVVALAGWADVPQVWWKARTLDGFVQEDAPSACVQVKCSKASRQGVATVAMTVTPIFGRKISYRAQKITVPEFVSESVVVTWPDGAYVELSNRHGLVGGGLPGNRRIKYMPSRARIVSGAVFRLEVDGLVDALPGLFEAYLPSGLSVGLDRRERWTVANGAKAGKVVYLRGTQTVDVSKLGRNPAGLKLTYAPKTRLFKGSFKVWQDVGGRVKGVVAKVAGILVDGEGYGLAQIGKLASVSMRLSGGVQLWACGPYWSECNVGAVRPEDRGDYFWWGDTMGYRREGGTLMVGGSYSDVTWVSSTGTQMDGSPFSSSTCPTFGMGGDQLRSAGYVGETGGLAEKHDAATARLGAPWRMPSAHDVAGLWMHCTVRWTTRNGVYGVLVTGRASYSANSIFLPAAGWGNASQIIGPEAYGIYFTATPDSGDSDSAQGVLFDADRFNWCRAPRYVGLSVRPVRSYSFWD